MCREAVEKWKEVALELQEHSVELDVAKVLIREIEALTNSRDHIMALAKIAGLIKEYNE